MTVRADPASSVLDRIKRTLVGLRMPRALEMVELTVRQLERGEVTPLEAIEGLLAEEWSLRESRRIKTALVMARLSTIKTLAGFDFAFQPSLDRNRVLALAQLDFVDRHEVVHLHHQGSTVGHGARILVTVHPGGSPVPGGFAPRSLRLPAQVNDLLGKQS